jgi:hypothetical protein
MAPSRRRIDHHQHLIPRIPAGRLLRKSRYRGVERTHSQGQYVAATCNLVRMARLMMTAPPKPAGA